MAMTATKAMDCTVAVAERIIAGAIWWQGSCNWVGAEPLERPRIRGVTPAPMAGLAYRSLGPDVYGGTAGVALYLAEFAAATGHPAARLTACGAIAHALSHSEDIAPEARQGLYVGWSGIAYAAIRIGTLLHESGIVEQGSLLLMNTARDHAADQKPADGSDAAKDTREFDLIAGTAGAVLALLEGHRQTGTHTFLELAHERARELVRSAQRTDIGWSWRTPGPRNVHDLLGLSHGTSGAAVALIECFRATAEEEFATAAREACRYENHWLDVKERNWPDFRPDVNGRLSPGSPRIYPFMWCHGAPGIALARLHAYRHLGDHRWLADAMLAARATAESVRSQLRGNGANYSLCHGLSGNAGSVLAAVPLLADACHFDSDGMDARDDELAALPGAVANRGAELYVDGGLPWPCGTHTEETPNLMLGLAGIGHFYLTLAVPTLRSVLLPVAESDGSEPPTS